ncbi:hypothetical protein [Candidatus Manganitrophus noduliformans]|uniref:Replication-relaxation n=1 Tax=Candidatus Manganitrophus noduliformans TaxID=2606439 RepID=A0A7X6DMX0_9BACT|nr:hypothetical protein [Candidatus Manganitrophus noduliformans]NKE70183.1 hypothetical protein [Candidatus Manganitrophus noduliformans]
MSLKGLHLTDRDIDVLKYLAYGPAFSDDLHARFFVKSGKPIDRSNFEKRMKKLKDANHLQSMNPQMLRQRNAPNHRPVYSIAERGVEVLTSEGMNVDRIRLVNLNKRSIPHEMILTRLVRKIYEFDGVRYQVIRLYDDVMLSKLAPRWKMQRIPDVRFTVQLKNGSYFSFLVEVDAGSTHPTEFSRKLVAFTQVNRLLAPVNSKDPFGILVVCDTENRMRVLQRAVQENSFTAKIKPWIAFNTIYNLDNSLGLFNPWYRSDGTKIETIFKEIRMPLKIV